MHSWLSMPDPASFLDQRDTWNDFMFIGSLPKINYLKLLVSLLLIKQQQKIVPNAATLK